MERLHELLNAAKTFAFHVGLLLSEEDVLYLILNALFILF